MENRFKFRGKRTDNEGWIIGNLLQNDIFKDLFYITVHDKLNRRRTKIYPETLGQCTGLTDKNGKDVFEGDIVTFGQRTYQIVFECGSFALCDKDGEMISKIGGINDHCYSLMNLYLECCWEENSAYDIEIIGNIYDNPELLKAVQND